MLLQILIMRLLTCGVTALATRSPDSSLVRRDISSGNWCGQVLHGSNFREVSASWVVPTASPLYFQYYEQPIYNYQWVGIDGASPSCQAILQAGTYARLQNNVLTYGFWYEFYPKTSWLMDQPVVRPGDTVFILVKAYNTTSGFVYMENRSTGQSYSLELTAPDGFALCGSTVEWIQEDASQSPWGLAPFTTFSFDECNAADIYGNRRNLAGSENWVISPSYDTLCYPSPITLESVQINYSGWKV